jgi:hypothetical protein
VRFYVRDSFEEVSLLAIRLDTCTNDVIASYGDSGVKEAPCWRVAFPPRWRADG